MYRDAERSTSQQSLSLPLVDLDFMLHKYFAIYKLCHYVPFMGNSDTGCTEHRQLNRIASLSNA